MTSSANSITKREQHMPEAADAVLRANELLVPRIDETAAKPRYADWRAELAVTRLFAKYVVDAGLKQHGAPPNWVASDVIAAVADAVL